MTQKYCNKCQQWKDTSEFYKHGGHKDGLSSNCKACTNKAVAEYRQTDKGAEVGKRARRKYKEGDKGKTVNLRYNKSEKGRENYRRGYKKYITSPHGKERIKEYKRSDASKESYRRRYAEHPDRARARTTVNRAVAKGRLPKVSTQICAHCGLSAQNYHHWSYEKEHWLDVVPLCIPCHIIADKEMAQQQTVARDET